MVDLTDHPHADLGTGVQLWGDCLSVNTIAHACHTSAYALLCGVKRVPRRYVDTSAPCCGEHAEGANT